MLRWMADPRVPSFFISCQFSVEFPGLPWWGGVIWVFGRKPDGGGLSCYFGGFLIVGGYYAPQ